MFIKTLPSLDNGNIIKFLFKSFPQVILNDLTLVKILHDAVSSGLPEDRECQNYKIIMRNKREREREKRMTVPSSHMLPTIPHSATELSGRTRKQ